MNRYRAGLLCGVMGYGSWVACLGWEVLPEERRIEWAAGIAGGIAEVTGPVVSVLDYGADRTGVADSHRAFARAISAVPGTGGVVWVPAGDYLLNATLGINRSNVVIRGEGPDKTRLKSNYAGVAISVESFSIGTWRKAVGGYGLGSAAIEVEDGTPFKNATFIEIQQSNDAAVMYTKTAWKTSWAENSVGQLVELAGVEGNTLLLKRKLHIGYSAALDPVVRVVGMVRGVGFEDLRVEKLQPVNHTFVFTRAAYCWLRNVESHMTRRSHVKITAALGLEIRRCVFHDSYSYGDGGSGYGVECSFHTTDVLVVDNLFDTLRHAMMVQTGANGNVFAYNYSTNPVQGQPGGKLNSGWIPPDISVHGHYPFMNLFEGNVVHEIGISDYWGPVGPGNTYFRNRVIGDGILYYDHSHEQNVIGNITTRITNTDGTSKRLLEHGNVVNGVTVWSPGIAGRDMPPSLYLDAAPEFFGELAWPAFGPDVAAGRKIPAQQRFERRAKWAAFARDSTGRVDTGPWLGWLSVNDESDWIWSHNRTAYLYLPPAQQPAHAGWVFVARQEG